MQRCLRRLATKLDRKGMSIKEKVEAQMKLESETRGRCAQYPHRMLTRPTLPLSMAQIREATTNSRIMSLNKMATDLKALSFSGQKGHWDAQVILLKPTPEEKEFEVWLNPSCPGYDDKHSVAPMFGMWENCLSCGSATAWILRPQSVVVKGFDEFGNEKTELMSGIKARLLMHEMDHLQGKTIIQQALGPEFIVSQSALAQKALWPPNFPSAEAYVTGAMQFFDYVTNEVVIPKGFEWAHATMNMQQFVKPEIDEGTR